MHHPRAILALALVLLTLLTACGSKDQPTPTAPAPAASPVAATSAPDAPPADAVGATSEPIAPTAAPTQAPTATPRPVAPTAQPPAATPAVSPPPATPPSVDPATLSLGLDLFADGLQSPVFATHAGDGSGRLFVVEKPGRVVVFGRDGRRQETFLDIRDRVGSDSSEQGLLGLAFHPQFAENGRLFVYYTDKNGDTVISRFQANAERSAADPAAEAVLLTAEQPAANHNGGMLAFGPDGMLYAGLGDGGAANDRFGNGQRMSTLLGKILRLDVDASELVAVPADNPFVSQEAVRPEIWAYGLRNPWRFSFDRQTGDLWIADVGQNQWEEVNLQPAGSPGGENYGWPIMEGTHCFQVDACDQSGLALPVVDYSHGEGCSITGGYVYRGAAQPAFQGVYLYGDYCSGMIWGLAKDGENRWRSAELLDAGLQISSFGETEDGEVLVVDLNGGVYQVVQK